MCDSPCGPSSFRPSSLRIRLAAPSAATSATPRTTADAPLLRSTTSMAALSSELAPPLTSRVNSESHLDEPGGAHGVQQDFLDELLRGHDGLAGTDRRPRSLKALRLDLPELSASGAVEKADRALPTGRCVDAAQPLVHSRPPAARD